MLFYSLYVNEKQIYFVKASKPDHHNENVCVSKVKCKKQHNVYASKKDVKDYWSLGDFNKYGNKYGAYSYRNSRIHNEVD